MENFAKSLKTHSDMLVKYAALDVYRDRDKWNSSLVDMLEEIENNIAQYLVNPSIQACLRKDKPPPIINEDLATLMEWQTIIQSILNQKDESQQNAHYVRILRRTKWKEAKFGICYFPVLAEYDYRVRKDVQAAIDTLKLLGQETIDENIQHQTRLAQWTIELDEQIETSKKAEKVRKQFEKELIEEARLLIKVVADLKKDVAENLEQVKLVCHSLLLLIKLSLLLLLLCLLFVQVEFLLLIKLRFLFKLRLCSCSS